MSTGILERIVAAKTRRVDEAKKRVSFDALSGKISCASPSPSLFREKISGGSRISIIGEMKKKSPSGGVLRKDFNPESIIAQYEDSGVSALSVVTEEDFFAGSPAYLETARKISSKPLLRKDFIVDAYQIWESRAAGADCILLIACILDAETLKDFIATAERANLECLVEVHTPGDIAKAAEAGAGIFGINNRDLKTFRVDLRTSEKLIKLLPGAAITVCESGIQSRDDIVRLESAGADAVLVGEYFMKSPDIKKAVEELLS